MWFEILLALKMKLMEAPELAGVVVAVGNDAAVPDYAKVVLIRGSFQPKTNDRASLNRQTIYIECFQFDDGDNPEKGYEKLSELEAHVFSIVNNFGLSCVDGKRIKLRLGESEPDGDIFRPSVGSRTAVTIEWQ